MKRRTFLSHGVALGASVSVLGGCQESGSNGANATSDGASAGTDATIPDKPGSQDTPPSSPSGPYPFHHGVASGDPLPHQVVMWTRVTLPDHDEIPVRVEVARDPSMGTLIHEGVAYARSGNDFTVKHDPALPDPGTTYYFRFEVNGHYSPIGRTRTASSPSADPGHLRMAVVSCSNYAHGYFNAYRRIASRPDLDAVIHLGDYIYEYAQGEYGDPDLAEDRALIPSHELLRLDDYRRRYAQYRQDPDLAECHRQHPFICVWDDHEIANDAWREGAENHDPNRQGEFQRRKRDAVQAYHEWMPIRSTLPDRDLRIYRRFRYGNLLTLMMLDTRLVGRDEQVNAPADARDRERSLIGNEQRRWLFQQLEQSRDRGATWHMIGQQVMLAPLTLAQGPDLPNLPFGGGIQLNYDQWDGYQTSRRALLQRIEAMGLDNTVVLTGDIHSSWAMDVALDPGNPLAYNRFTGEGSLAVEFVTPAVTSPGIEDEALAGTAANALKLNNRHLKYVDLYHRGYMVLDITPERCKTDWFHLDTVSERRASEVFGASWFTASGTNHVQKAELPSSPKDNPPAFAPESNTADTQKETVS